MFEHPEEPSSQRERAEPPQGYLLVQTRDFDELARAFQQWQMAFQQISRGPFRGELQLAHSGSVQVLHVTTNRVLQARGFHRIGSYAFSLVQPSCAGALWRYRQLEVGEINIRRPAEEINHLTSLDYASLSVSVEAGALRK